MKRAWKILLFVAVILSISSVCAVAQSYDLNDGNERVRVYAGENIDLNVDTDSSRSLSFRSNLLYFCGGLINGGVEWRPASERVGYLLNGGYSPFAGQDWEHNMGGFFISPEVRLYMGSLRRGYLGAQAIVVGYNYKMSETGYQGEMYGVGLVGGYRVRISKHFDMDFTLGIGAAKFDYGSYRIIYNGMSLYNECDIEKWACVPIQLGVSLILGRY